jgi:heme-degrading monooxygenase HmoA
MIARVWHGRSSVENGPRYVEHLKRSVFPEIREFEGHQGAYLLERTVGDRIEFMVTTLWDSMEAIQHFAGERPEKAVVAPAAQAVLADFDEDVAHYTVSLTGSAAAAGLEQGD